MLSRFEEARAKPTFSASPSITSAVLPKPSLPNCAFSVLVLPSATSRLSMIRRLPSLAFDDSAILRPSWRTFLLRLEVNTRARWPCALPPPMKIGARRSPWRAVPPPFCLPNFFPVRLTSLRSRAARAGARRLISCQVTTRCRMSARGSTPKMSSLSSMSPPLPASRVCTLTFILAFLAFVGVGSRLDAVLGRAGLFIFCGLGRVGRFSFGGLGSFGRGRCAGVLLGGDGGDFLVARKRRNLVNRGVIDQASGRDFRLVHRLHLLDNAGGIRRGVGARQLDRVADGKPAALMARDRALD